MLRRHSISGGSAARVLLAIIVVAGIVLCGVAVSPGTPVQGAETTLSISDMAPALMAAGYNHSLLVGSDGTLWAWGWNRYGQLGLGDFTDRLIPTPVGTATNWAAVTTGWHHSLGLRSDDGNDGTLWAWGKNEYGQLGLGYISDYEDEPQQVVVGSDWVAVSSGRYHTLGIRSDGTLWAWGRNNNGQLGLGSADSVSHPTPQKVGSLSGWVSIACGDVHSLGVRSDGTLWAWGNNSSGELGLGHQSNDGTGSPQKVGAATGWATVASDFCYSMGIKKDATLWAWGPGYQGQLGLGENTTTSKVPIKVGADWAGVYPGRVHCLGVRSDGTMWAWGQNFEGELGLGDGDYGVTKYSPQMVLGSATNWLMGASGDAFSVGLRSDGAAWGWGRNGEGQLGVNDRAVRYEPTPCILTGDYPLSVGTQPASGILENGATLNGSLIGLGEASSVQVYFEWGLTTSYGNTTASKTRTATGTFSASLTGLAAGTTYYCRARAYADGEAVYGNGRSFTTATAGTPVTAPTVTTVAAGSVTETSATLNGSLTSMGAAGSVVVYFEYGTATGSYSQHTEDQTLNAAGPFDAGLTGLAAGTTYYFRARADGDGDPVYGAEATFTTTATPVTPPMVATHNATDLAANSATLHGNLTSMGTAGSVIVYFECGTATNPYVQQTDHETLNAAGAFQARVTGLAADTTYYYRVRVASDGADNGGEVAFTTPGTSADAPVVETADADSITTGSARLNGNLTSLGAAGKVTVLFVWGVAPGSYPCETPATAEPGTGAFYFDLGGLSPDTTYYYRAYAAGNGTSYGPEKSFATGQRPEVEGVDAGSGKQGQHLTVTISGASFDGAAIIGFGPGVTVEDFSVNSSTEITVEIAIDGNAEPGARDVSVTTGWGTGTVTDGFSVVGGGGGFCNRASAETPVARSEMTTTMAALGLVLGTGYWFARNGAKKRRE